MENQLLITQKEDDILTVWVEENKIKQIQAEPVSSEGILGNIYVGKVRNIVKNINAAFVEFQKGQMGYLSLQNEFCPIHTDGVKHDQNRVLIGDEIIVQVEKEAVKTKPPTLTGNLDLSGKYVVLTVGKPQVSISRKIKDKEVRQRLHDILSEYGTLKEYGFIARTNSAAATTSEIENEVKMLCGRYEQIVRYGKHKAQFSCLYQAPAVFLSSIMDMYQERIQNILTDSEWIYQTASSFIKENHWENQLNLSLWNPERGKMDAVYDISKTLTKALQPKVWLKHGGYLIIQPTEALVSIDVNTGKAISKKKDVQKNFLKVNQEAAVEIAHQLRLRNLSGIILVDFIDMNTQEANQELLDTFRRELGKDPVPAKLVDMTKLGLVEVTRKKVRKPLYEQIKKRNGEHYAAG